ncbi:hypothetical protein A2856_01645 [Candidatus Uhrbacteria bacterium RIFCSPHIGHO2_01_FULL_63_20]|uniref:Uncharacterized protein n=1 Tax=Candidatus Uhrbacteria bacterium RIFCSPHIGHO2_01_FULL_63_20 TaxID=1802385 RepID=A0A1F7TLE0_9BACT|nr:MAG: hypothetical protein A2856_01645 [Candidatus Uhrbacteria bacterium RIFCSPHIGHO2_01_FULL_63_20]
MILEDIFLQAGAIIVLAAALSFAAYRLRQPLIMAYVVAGVVAGPMFAVALADSRGLFDVMSRFGVAFLLFTVGLGLNWKGAREIGKVALATGIGQIAFVSILGFALTRALGFDLVTAAYVAVATSFSSTIVVVKLLSDKDDLDSLYGRVSVGFLLVQDFIAMLALLALGAFGSGAGLEAALVSTFVKGLIALPVLWLVATRLAPSVVAYAAKSQELLFVFALAWCFLVAGALNWLGFGIELGALIAGITLSGSPFVTEIAARVRPIRDFFLVAFFIMLGTHLDPGLLTGKWPSVAAFSAFVLLGSPVVMTLIMRVLGYHPRTGFMTGTTVAQVSEFSYIIIALGVALGHIAPETLAFVTAVGLVTIAGSSYLIEFNETLYDRLRPLMRWLEPRAGAPEGKGRPPGPPQVLLFGFHRVGVHALRALRSMRRRYLIADFDPDVVKRLSESGEPVVYGDVSDERFLEELHAAKAGTIISTVPDADVSIALLTFLRSRAFKGSAIVAARTHAEASRCYEAGATYVIVPNLLGGERFAEMLEKSGTRRREWASLGAEQKKEIEAERT